MRTLARRALGLAIAASLVGCSTPPATTGKADVKFTNRTESTDPAGTAAEMKSFTPTEDGSNSEKLLEQKLNAYTTEISPHMRDRAERKKLNTVGSGGAATQPSQVQWPSANGQLLAPNAAIAPPPDATAAAVPANTSNQKVALATPAKTAGSDVPQIVPEGEDTVANTGPHDPPADTDQLLTTLSGKIHDNPRDVASQLDYQLIQFLRGEQVPDMKSISGLPAEDREVITALVDGLSNFRNNVRNDSNEMLSDKIRPLVEMADRLRGEADLTLPAAALCTRVDGYGVYDPIEPAHFGAGKDHPVIVYCEVANFASQINDKKLWETKLSNEVILYTDTGMVAWSEKSKSIVDTSRNRRHDFFLIKKTKLPGTLPMGRYIMKISVTDQQSNRVAETNIPVQIDAE